MVESLLGIRDRHPTPDRQAAGSPRRQPPGSFAALKPKEWFQGGSKEGKAPGSVMVAGGGIAGMQAAAKKLVFERAAALRDRIRALERGELKYG